LSELAVGLRHSSVPVRLPEQEPLVFEYDGVFWLEALIPNLWMYMPVAPTYTRIHINGVTFKSTSTSSAWIFPPSANCGAVDLGIKINGFVSLPLAYNPDPTQLRLCLDTDTGTGTTGNFTTISPPPPPSRGS
jgi:hypothetical protein